MAAAVILTAGIYYETQNDRVHRNELKASVANELNLIGARLQGEVSADVTALRGFANLYAASPADGDRRFDVFARRLLLQKPQLRRIAAAPGGVVRRAYPAAGNESYIGTDFNRFRSFRIAAQADRSRGRPLMLGPVQMPDGTRGFNLFLPVFTRASDHHSFWGYVDGVIDERKLFVAAGLIDAQEGTNRTKWTGGHGILLSIRDVSVPDNVLEPFFGDPEIFNRSPVLRKVGFPGGQWELAAIPADGWTKPPENLLQIRLMVAGAAFVIIVPIFLTGGLVSERQRNIADLKAREKLVLSLSQRLDLALGASKIGIWDFDLAGGNRNWDERMFHLHGIAVGQTPSDEGWRRVVHPDDVAVARTAMQTVREGNNAYWSQYRVVLPNGDVRHIRNVGSCLTNQQGEKTLTGISWDVTEDVLMNERLREAKEQSDRQNAKLARITQRLDLALDSYKCGLWEADLETGLTLWDERMHQLYGVERRGDHITHETWVNALHPDDREEALAKVSQAVEEGVPYLRKSRVVHPDGTIRHIQSVGALHVDADGRKLVGLAVDVTDDVLLNERLKAAKAVADAKNAELEQAKNRIEHNALHDPLTGLANRRKLDDDLHRLALRSHDEDIRVGILHIDLDRFKQINDTLGHAAGDALLVHASGILRSSVRNGDLVARIGGDEFVVVATNTTDQSYLTNLSQRIIGLMQQPVDYNGHPCRFGVSIGIALGRGRDIDTRRLLVNADIALYRAKALGRNRHEFFTEALQAEIISNKRIADDILSGIENNEFVPFYQPQIDAHTLKLAGAEALIRWRHPRDGLLTPDRFLKIAEDLNVMATLDRIVLEKALIDASRWAAQGLVLPKISVNVSARRLRDETLVNSLAGLSIRPGQIAFELVESIFLDESDDVVLSNLEKIKDLGIDIEIDDFGTGHTSIVSLLKLKPKRLKIDRQLVAPILSSRNEQTLVRSIIEIGRSLGIEIVAEGVETMQHAEVLSMIGCDLLQGYAFARPLPCEDFIAFAGDSRWRLAS